MNPKFEVLKEKDASDTKLLVITCNAWANNISTGNTFSNFLSNWNGDVANIYCRNEKINNNICKKYYRITEKNIIKNFFDKEKIGCVVNYEDFSVAGKSEISSESANKNNKFYGFFRRHRLIVLLWIRELIWKIGRWKNNSFENFVKNYNPNVVMMPMYSNIYMYDILFYVKKLTNAKIVLCTGDDVYSLKKWRFSPFFWINKFFLRRKMRKAVNISNRRFSLTDMQSEEYSTIFNKQFKTLRKGMNFEKDRALLSLSNGQVIDIVYTGNILLGRYKILGLIGDAVHKVNKLGKKYCLHIYSADSLSNKMKNYLLKYPNDVIFHGRISSEEVKKVQLAADILLHVENFSLKDKLTTRLSFSTKLVDYFYQGKCIFAVGPKDVASIDYLMKNDAAVVATNEKEIYEKLKMLVENPDIIREYGDKAWDCGKRNHQIDKIQKMLYEDFERVIHENNEA